MEFLQVVNAKGRLGARFTRWGRWWDRENEIDVVALDNDSYDILFCECKFAKDKGVLLFDLKNMERYFDKT